jgi:hypothetical protein
MSHKSHIAFFLGALAMVSCGQGSRDTGSATTDTAQSSYFANLTATLNCVDGSGVAQPPITANAIGESTGIVSQVPVPPAIQGGSCNIFLRGTPRPEYAARIRWTGVGPSATGLAYVATKVPVSRDPAQAQGLIVNTAFIKTYEINATPSQSGQPGTAQPNSGQPGVDPSQPQGPAQPKVQTPSVPPPATGTVPPQGGSAPGDVMQALRAKGAQNVTLGGTYCGTFRGQPWFTNPIGVYADESRGVIWTCRGDQVWQGSCARGSKNSAGSCNP